MEIKLLGEKIKYFRKSNNIKQSDLSNKLGISRTALSYYESGKYEPNIFTLLKLSKVMNCSINYLIDDSIEVDNLLVQVNLEKDSFHQNIKKDITKSTIQLLEKERKTYKSMLSTLPNKIKEIDDLISLLKSKNENNTKSTKLEVANEVAPNIVDLEEKRESNRKTYRYIDCFGNVAAGDPRCAFEVLLDTFKINSDLLSDSKEYFILKISGDSMNEIFDDGEYVLIEKTAAIYDNDLIIAIIEGEATCKKIRFYDDEINLIPMSTNPNHKTQIYTSKKINICGKVVGKLSDYLEKDE